MAGRAASLRSARGERALRALDVERGHQIDDPLVRANYLVVVLHVAQVGGCDEKRSLVGKGGQCLGEAHDSPLRARLADEFAQHDRARR